MAPRVHQTATARCPKSQQTQSTSFPVNPTPQPRPHGPRLRGRALGSASPPKVGPTQYSCRLCLRKSQPRFVWYLRRVHQTKVQAPTQYSCSLCPRALVTSCAPVEPLYTRRILDLLRPDTSRAHSWCHADSWPLALCQFLSLCSKYLAPSFCMQCTV